MTTTGTGTRTATRTFADIEASIETHINAWRQLARDFADIRDGAVAELQGINRSSPEYNKKLKKLLGHKTLEEYWRSRWGITKQHVNRLIASVEIVADVSSEPVGSDGIVDETSGTTLPEGISERVFRPLRSVPKEDRKKVFERAKQKAAKEGKRVSSKHTKEAADEYNKGGPRPDEDDIRHALEGLTLMFEPASKIKDALDELVANRDTQTEIAHEAAEALKLVAEQATRYAELLASEQDSTPNTEELGGAIS